MGDGKGGTDTWSRIVADIEWLAENRCYERVNFFTSLLTLDTLRRRAARMLRGRRVVLDAGAGPGFSSQAILTEAGAEKLVLVDPSVAMLRQALALLNGWDGAFTPVLGVFESIPLASGSVEGVVAMFAFRDAIDYRAAVREMCRVLTSEGSLVVLDIYRPDSLPEEFAIRTYLALIPSLAALLTGCLKGAARYFSLEKTLDRMPRLSELLGILRGYFREVKAEKVMPGTVLIEAGKPRKEACEGGGLG